MKKFLYLVLLLCICFVLCACNDSESVVETPVPQATEEIIISSIRISELMSSNKTTYPGPAAEYPDWLELVNTGSEIQSLSGLSIQRGGNNFPLPEISLSAGERILLICSEDVVEGMYCTGFKLPKEGFRINLMQGDICVQELTVPPLDSDVSCLVEDDNYAMLSYQPSPGFESFEEYQAQLECSSPLLISEAMIYNRWYMPINGEYYDWVELKNNSSDTISLSDYYLSDKSTELKRYRLPEIKLASGEYTVIYFDELCVDGSRAPFGLSADGDELYISDESAHVLDAAALRGIPYGGSYGRMDGENGFFYFSNPSPQKVNAGGMRSISSQPVLLSKDGVFNNVDSVRVELEGSNLYYTLDGSLPTESSLAYTGPFTVSETCVVRVVSLENGKLPSKPLNLSYIINENHSIPVMSITADPEIMFGKAGIYKNPEKDLRTTGGAMFYENGKSFSINCDIALHGATSKLSQSKKSFNLYFRSALDGKLNYDLFENGVNEYSKIILRAAQETYFSSMMRDNLMHQLSIQSFPSLPAQDYKYCVLYINGEYWGVYNLREAHGETHFAQHYGVDEELVKQYKGSWNGSGFNKYYSFIMANDMSNDENYAYAAEHLDIDSLIGWTIMQAYSGNMDLNPPNARFYFREDEQKLYYALVDLDLGMNEFYAFPVPYANIYDFNTLLIRMSNNEQFRLQLARELSRVLHSTMSDENVLALIDSMAEEFRPEMARNGERWEMQLENWEKMVKSLRNYIDGRAKYVAGSFLENVRIPRDEFKSLFGDIK